MAIRVKIRAYLVEPYLISDSIRDSSPLSLDSMSLDMNCDVPNSFVTSKNNIFCKVELKMVVYSPSVTASDISQDSKVSFEGFSKGARAAGIGEPRCEIYGFCLLSFPQNERT